jgi:hypothetical protein
MVSVASGKEGVQVAAVAQDRRSVCHGFNEDVMGRRQGLTPREFPHVDDHQVMVWEVSGKLVGNVVIGVRKIFAKRIRFFSLMIPQ